MFSGWLLSNMKGQPLHALSICFGPHRVPPCVLSILLPEHISDFAQPFQGLLHPGSPDLLLWMNAHLDLSRTPAERVLKPQCRLFSAAGRAPGHITVTSRLHVGAAESLESRRLRSNNPFSMELKAAGSTRWLSALAFWPSGL